MKQWDYEMHKRGRQCADPDQALVLRDKTRSMKQWKIAKKGTG